MKLKETKYVFCDVQDTRYITLGDFRLFLPELDTAPNLSHRLFIKKAVIPFNWKTITSTTNIIRINNVDRTLQEGIPNVTDLVTMLNTAQNVFLVTFDKVASRLVWTNVSGATATINSTTCTLLGLTTLPVMVSAGGVYTSPNILDIRPPAICQIRIDAPTAGQEVITGGEVRNTGLLAAIAMDCPIYSHKIWTDTGLFFAPINNDARELRIQLTDQHDNPIVPQTSPYFVWGIDTYIDEEKELLQTQQKSLELQKYGLLLQHGNKLGSVQENIPVE